MVGNLWAVALTAGGILLVVTHEWLAKEVKG